MTYMEFIEQQIFAGYRVHFNNGTWWQEIIPFFCRPVVPLHEINPGKSKPKYYKSFLGYKHLVSDDQSANKYWPVMLLSKNKLKDYTIYTVSPSKRAQVRKGLKNVEIKRIQDIEPVIEDVKNICISTRQRTNHGKPEKYYLTREWRSWITKEFALSKREWWGAYYKGKLIAYIYCVQIEETMFIYAAKSHTDFLGKCPNDALIFTFINYCKDLPNCNQIIFGDGGPVAQSVSAFKEKLGFEEINLPVYAHYNPIITLYNKRNLLFPYFKR